VKYHEVVVQKYYHRTFFVIFYNKDIYFLKFRHFLTIKTFVNYLLQFQHRENKIISFIILSLGEIQNFTKKNMLHYTKIVFFYWVTFASLKIY
jgi:hypothetical protein